MSRIATSFVFASLLVVSLPSVWAQTGTLRFETAPQSDEAVIGGLQLRVFEAGSDSVSYSLLTDEQGVAQREGVPFGTYYAYPDPDSGVLTSVPYTPALIAGPSETEAGTLNVFPPDPDLGILRGLLTDAATGQPIRTAISSYTASPSGPETGTTYTLSGVVDGEGFFFQASPEVWEVELDVFPLLDNEIYRTATFSYTAVAGEVAFQDIAVDRIGQQVLLGTVRDINGAPVASTDVTLFDVVRFSADGFETEFFDDRPSFDLATPLALGSSENAFDLGDIMLDAVGGDAAGPALSGRIVDSVTNEAIEGALVAALRTDAPGVGYAVTSADGRYDVEALEPGSYVVLITADGHTPAYYPDADTWTDAAVLSVEGDVAGVEAALVQSFSPPAVVDLMAFVRDAEGQPVEAALVTARDVNGQLRDFGVASETGRVRLGDLRGQPVTLQVDAPRFDAATWNVEVPADLGQPVMMTMNLAPFSPVSNEAAPTSEPLALIAAPNPARDRVVFSFDDRERATVQIFDVLGRTVASFGEAEVRGGRIDFDTSRLRAGMYFVRLATEEGQATKRFTVVR